jgi:hypothetical protein
MKNFPPHSSPLLLFSTRPKDRRVARSQYIEDSSAQIIDGAKQILKST